DRKKQQLVDTCSSTGFGHCMSYFLLSIQTLEPTIMPLDRETQEPARQNRCRHASSPPNPKNLPILCAKSNRQSIIEKKKNRTNETPPLMLNGISSSYS